VNAVEFAHIDKSFGAVTALRDVGFSIAAGEAHAIVGENGAGKSTLLKILAGELQPDRGELRLGGQAVALWSPRDALARGIGLVHQEMLLFPNLTVAGNIFAGRELTGRFGALREAAMRDRARMLLARLHLAVSPDTAAEALPIAHRQLLQVARALAFDCRILALDEPTTSLTAAESEHLFRILGDLQGSGVTIIYVSHRLPEVFRLCTRATVLRDGQLVTTVRLDEASSDYIVQAMVGRSIPARTTQRLQVMQGSEVPTAVIVDRLTSHPCFEDISLSVRAGEIVGIFGLVGSGRTELLESMVGLRPVTTGMLIVDGKPRRFRSPRDAARAGVVLVPEDRQREGLFFNLDLRDNIALPTAEAMRTRVIRSSERESAANVLRRWRIVAPSIEVTPDVLSGGNQQKVVAAKWLALNPRVLLLDEPTKGVDVGAKQEIHGIVRELAAAGTACLVVSSDLPELLALADRILVMRQGRMRGEVAGASADEEGVMRLAATDDAGARRPASGGPAGGPPTSGPGAEA
jgi:ABC-type sugar transport system ATPase subunit